MDSSLLKTFLILAKTKNFTQAASKLYRSQSAISLQISRLESLLGKTLFTRDNRNVQLTFDGEKLVSYAQEILKIEDEMILHFKQADSLTGEVKFGTPEDVATVYLASIMANFSQSYPLIHLNVHCELTKPLIAGFEACQYDLVLIKQDPLYPHPQAHVVWNENLVWVCHRQFQHHFQTLDEPYPLILAPSPCVYRQKAIDALTQAGVPFRHVFSSPSFTGMCAAAKAGLGICVMPQKMTPKDFVVLKNLPQLMEAQIAILKQTNASAAVHALATYVEEHILIDTQVEIKQ